MSNLNSSGSQERFTLASAEQKTWVNLDAGGNHAQVELAGDDQAAAAVSVKLQTSEDGSSFSDVGSAVSVVPRGKAVLAGATGKYTRVVSTAGTDIVHVVVKLRARADVVGAL